MVLGEDCRSGCKSKDHSSYAECLSDIGVQVAAASFNSPLAPVFDQTKKELSAYANARANGIWPSGTTMAKIKDAERASRLLGRPYDSGVDAPSKLIVNENTAKFANMKD